MKLFKCSYVFIVSKFILWGLKGIRTSSYPDIGMCTSLSQLGSSPELLIHDNWKSRRGQFIWLYMVKQGALIHYQVLPDMMHSNAADNFSHASVRHADERTHILKAISGPLSESINHAGSIDNGWCSWCRSPFTAYWPDGSVNVTYICEDATVSSDTHQ